MTTGFALALMLYFNPPREFAQFPRADVVAQYREVIAQDRAKLEKILALYGCVYDDDAWTRQYAGGSWQARPYIEMWRQQVLIEDAWQRVYHAQTWARDEERVNVWRAEHDAAFGIGAWDRGLLPIPFSYR